MKQVNLTPKQKAFLDFIKSFIKENGFSPTQSEIQIKFGFKSTGSVQDYSRQLIKKGFLTNNRSLPRGLTPTEGCPVCGCKSK